MGRINVFEWEDQEWFPRTWRDYGTDLLQFGANKTDMYRDVVPILKRGLERSGSGKIIDLCSGGGGGWLKLSEHMEQHVPGLSVLLTDYFPNVPAFKEMQRQSGVFEYSEQPVNALDVPREFRGLRTQFLSFHHFCPDDARKILKDAVEAKQPIAIFEAQERSFLSLCMMLVSPIVVLLMTPFIQPFRLGRMVLTYLIPVVPLFMWWDGVASSLRTYSVNEMNMMIGALDDRDAYTWETGKIRSRPRSVLYLLGYPKERDEARR